MRRRGRSNFRIQWAFEIYCQDFFVAGRYAAAQNWWPHCWEWRTDAAAPEDPVVTTLREVDT